MSAEERGSLRTRQQGERAIDRRYLAKCWLGVDWQVERLREWQHRLLAAEPGTRYDALDRNAIQAPSELLGISPASGAERSQPVRTRPGQAASGVGVPNQVDPAHRQPR